MGKRFHCTLCDYSGRKSILTLTHIKNKHFQGSKLRTANSDDWQYQQINFRPQSHQYKTEIRDVIDYNQGEIISLEYIGL